METKFENRSDIKIQVIKAIAPTMEGEDEEEQKQNAGKSSIESVQRMGKYNPLRVCPVRVKFGNKSGVDHLLKNKKKPPKDVFIDKEYSCTVSLSLLAGCSSDSSKASTDPLGSHASLPPEPVNHADQHLRGLKQEPGVS